MRWSGSLFADDVGIARTIEAGLIAKVECSSRADETLERAVLPSAPPSSGSRELAEKFAIDAELVCPPIKALQRAERRRVHSGVSSAYPCTVISTDFIKSRHRRAADPENPARSWVIVDEAHHLRLGQRAREGTSSGRYDMLREVARDHATGH
jgi:hypothetical protein